ncbi:MAG: exostosin domain-containing protein [Planctomycetota bacterium]|jgi:hypothetical protein
MSSRRVRLIWQIDPHDPATWEREWLFHLLDAHEIEHVVDLNHQIVADHAIVVTAGLPKRGGDVAGYLRRFREAGHAVGVIHLSDERSRSPLSFYADAAFVYRNYFRPEALRFPHCRYFALGYKSGFTRDLTVRDMDSRKYTWAFAGQVKTSRAAMIRSAQRIPGGHAHITRSFADPEGLDVGSYADLLSNTVFALCPRGNVSVDCFRVYEALEAGAIPVIEDGGITPLWSDLRRPATFLKLHAWRPGYWRANLPLAFRGSYWLAAFGEDFPCPRLRHWRDLEEVLGRVDVGAISKVVRAWWTEHKRSLARNLGEAVDRHLLS